MGGKLTRPPVMKSARDVVCMLVWVDECFDCVYFSLSLMFFTRDLDDPDCMLEFRTERHMKTN